MRDQGLVAAISDSSTILVDIPGPGLIGYLVQFIVGGLGVGGALLVFWLSQKVGRDQRREDDSIRAAGELLIAMAEYQRLRVERVDPPPGTAPFFVPVFTTDRESEGYQHLRTAAAIYLPRLSDELSRTALRKLLEHLARYGWRAPDPFEGDSAEERAAVRAAEDKARDAAWASADQALSNYLEAAAGPRDSRRR